MDVWRGKTRGAEGGKDDDDGKVKRRRRKEKEGERRGRYMFMFIVVSCAGLQKETSCDGGYCQTSTYTNI